MRQTAAPAGPARPLWLASQASAFVVTIALQVLVSGLAAGGVYGLFAAGHSLVYRLTGIVHFAFGDLVGLGVFATLLVLAGTSPVTQSGAHEPRFLGALVVGLVLCVAAGMATYVGLVQPYLARGSTVGWVAGTAAVAFAIRAAIGAAFQRSSYVFPDPLPFHRVGHAGFIRFGGAQVEARAFFVIGLALALALGSAWLLERTRFGRALRAVADDAEGARVVGVPVDLLVALAFGLVGALAMIAALAAAPGEAVNANTGTLLGLKGLVAALAVRFGPPLRAFVAGLVLGVVEAGIANVHLGSWQLGPAYREVLPLAFVLLLISARPSREALEEHE